MKIQRYTQKQQEEEFTHQLAYEEWLRDNVKEPTNSEINKMEKVYSKSNIAKNPISHIYPLIHPINQIQFQPLQGA